MSKRLILIGGGEHARVVADALYSLAHRFDVLGFVDGDPTAMIDGLEHLGSDDVIEAHQPALGLLAVGAVSASAARAKIVERLSPKLAGWGSVLHSSAWVSQGAQLEEGTVVMAGAVVQSGARIGRHSIVNSGVIVEHDVGIGAFAVLAPGVVVGGGAMIGDGAVIGLGSSIRDHIHIGQWSTIGMGSVVVDDVDERTTVMGHPAKIGVAP